MSSIEWADFRASIAATLSSDDSFMNPSMSPLRKVESNHCIIKSSIKHVLKTHNDADIQRYTVA